MRNLSAVENRQDTIFYDKDKYVHFTCIFSLDLVNNNENSIFSIFWKFEKSIKTLSGLSNPYFGYIFEKVQVTQRSLKTI